MAHHLKHLIKLDTSLPEALRTKYDLLTTAMIAGGTALGARAQEADGVARAVLDQAQREGRDLITHLETMRALTWLYEETEMPVHLIRLREAWIGLHRFWGPEGLPIGLERDLSASIEPAYAYKLLALWSETQALVKPAIESEKAGTSIDFEVWQNRMTRLKARLDSNAGTEKAYRSF
jgi:hypothetical protein